MLSQKKLEPINLLTRPLKIQLNFSTILLIESNLEMFFRPTILTMVTDSREIKMTTKKELSRSWIETRMSNQHKMTMN